MVNTQAVQKSVPTLPQNTGVKIKPGQESLTTAQAGRLIGYTAQSIINWVEQGLFPAHRINSGRRHIPIKEFVEFLKGQGYPIPKELIGR